MKTIATILLLLPLAIAAATVYLTDQWVKGGDNYCKYSDGSVLNMGYKICPVSLNR